MYGKRKGRLHFTGIGGAGMCGIAEVCLTLGCDVSGSDLRRTAVTQRLSRLGAKIAYRHDPRNVAGAEVVVVSTAVSPANPEVAAARAANIPVIPRAEMLSELMRLKYGIAVAGAHGKTSTSSLLGAVMTQAGLDPTCVIGGKLKRLESHARLGASKFMVVEADESDGSFMRLAPVHVIVTNIDREHLDHYGSIDAVKDAFVAFINHIPFYGVAALCIDDENIRSVLPRLGKRFVTYGIGTPADYMAREIGRDGLFTSFDLYRRGEMTGRFTVKLPGAHFVLNCLSVAAIADELGIDARHTRKALSDFSGIERRFELVGERGGVLVVDDYGHHPTEVAATLAAARDGFDRRVVVAFQPHRYTRTADLCREFARSFGDADVLVMTEIYPAGENPVPGVTGRFLFETVRASGHANVSFTAERSAVAQRLCRIVRPGDMVITLGAGDIWKTGRELLSMLGGIRSPRGRRG